MNIETTKSLNNGTNNMKTKYRMLESGEVIRDGDEVYVGAHSGWIRAELKIGYKTESGDTGYIRRPIPESMGEFPKEITHDAARTPSKSLNEEIARRYNLHGELVKALQLLQAGLIVADQALMLKNDPLHNPHIIKLIHAAIDKSNAILSKCKGGQP